MKFNEENAKKLLNGYYNLLMDTFNGAASKEAIGIYLENVFPIKKTITPDANNKESRIAELKKQIKEIESEKTFNYMLLEVIPDCGGGIRDNENQIVISDNFDNLVEYCEKEFEYTPLLESRKKQDGKKPCDKWYKIAYTSTQIL